MNALFRSSVLYRKKWEREDYRNRTISEALNGKTEFYQPPKTVKLKDGTDKDSTEEKEKRRSQADRLIAYALEDASALFTDQHGPRTHWLTASPCRSTPAATRGCVGSCGSK
jgi:hypothetical protein